MVKKIGGVAGLVLCLITGLNSGGVFAADEGVSFVEVDKVIKEAIADGVTPTAQVVITKDGDIVYEKAFGKWGENQIATIKTLYDLASVTKALATTQAIMKLDYEGKIDLQAPVTDYIREFGKNGKENVKISDLLTHTSGLTPWQPTYFYANNPEEELDYICNLPLTYPTGTDRRYSDFSFMTLGYVVESITGVKLNDYVEKTIYQPIGMKDTGFVPLKTMKGQQIAPTSMGNPFEYKMVDEDDFGYRCNEKADDFKKWRHYRLLGEVNDGNAWYAQQGVAGHAGLFSNANDLSRLTRLMLAGGQYNGVRLYNQKTIDTFTALQSSFGHGYGFEINRGGSEKGYMGLYSNDSFFGHSGFTGTQFIVDKGHDISVIILTNKQYKGVNAQGKYPSTFSLSRQVMQAVYESGLIEYKVEKKTADIIYQGQPFELSAYLIDGCYYVEPKQFEHLFVSKVTGPISNGQNIQVKERMPKAIDLKWNGQTQRAKSFVIEEKTYIHIRDLGDLTNLVVEWQPLDKTVKIKNK